MYLINQVTATSVPNSTSLPALWSKATSEEGEAGMSLQVLNAHTGARYSAGPESLTSLNTLRAWIAKASTVAAENQILLTAQGRQAKVRTLRVEVRSAILSSCII